MIFLLLFGLAAFVYCGPVQEDFFNPKPKPVPDYVQPRLAYVDRETNREILRLQQEIVGFNSPFVEVTFLGVPFTIQKLSNGEYIAQAMGQTSLSSPTAFIELATKLVNRGYILPNRAILGGANPLRGEPGVQTELPHQAPKEFTPCPEQAPCPPKYPPLVNSPRRMQFHLGKTPCSIFSTSPISFPLTFFFPNANYDELRRILRSIDPQQLSADGNTLLLVVTVLYLPTLDTLVDAGPGEAFGAPDEIYPLMIEQGIEPITIKHIFITHWHLDHVGGLVGNISTGKMFMKYPTATIYLSKVEYDWVSQLQDDPNNPQSALMRNIFNFLKPNIQFIEGERQVLPQVNVKPRYGHTPGHVAIEVKDGNRMLLCVGDIYVSPVQAFQTSLNIVYDTDTTMASKVREEVRNLVMNNISVTVWATHWPYPHKSVFRYQLEFSARDEL